METAVTNAPIPVFKTPYQEEREAKDLAIYNDYNELMKVPGQSATRVTAHIMEKYGVHSASTIYEIRKRVESRIAQNGQEGAL